MGKALKFIKHPQLEDFKGLSIKGHEFKIGKGIFHDEIILMEIPETFRFETSLEVAEDQDNSFGLIATQFLTRGPDYWEMEAAFDRVGFRNPEIEIEMKNLCNQLVERECAQWEEETE